VVEGAALEKQCTGNRTKGSNPFLSAILLMLASDQWVLYLYQMRYNVINLPGDGIGPEIMAPALEVVKAVAPEVEFEERLFGGASIDDNGEPLTAEVLKDCRQADGVLLAAIGGPKWDTTDSSKPRPEQALLGLRQGLGLYANLRPIVPLPVLYGASPLRQGRIEGTHLLFVRELTGGV
jgi:3-isopropylmalate dehydrogenase